MVILIAIDIQASPINLVGNGSFTTDVSTGLDWLKLNFIDGMSYNSAFSSVNVMDDGGWRFATDCKAESSCPGPGARSL